MFVFFLLVFVFVSPDEMLDECRLTETDQLDLLTRKSISARLKREAMIGQQFITAKRRLVFDRFPHRGFEVPFPPLQSVYEAKYLDVDGVWQTLDPAIYRVDANSRPGRIEPVDGKYWPPTHCGAGAIYFDIICGYGNSAEDVPQSIRDAIRVYAAQLFWNREEDAPMPQAVSDLLMSESHGTTLYDGLSEEHPHAHACTY